MLFSNKKNFTFNNIKLLFSNNIKLFFLNDQEKEKEIENEKEEKNNKNAKKSRSEKAVDEDVQEENTLSKMGHGHLMISYESIEISKFCSSSQYSWVHQILVICNKMHVVITV